MTMHLIKGITSLSTRKPKVKMTKAKLAMFRDQHIEHNKFLKSLGTKPMSFDEYIDYVHGRTPKVSKPKASTLSVSSTKYRRETEYIPSLSVSVDQNSCTKRDSIKYTGTLVKGIATMHKSNAVPVIDEEQMRDISRMRRG